MMLTTHQNKTSQRNSFTNVHKKIGPGVLRPFEGVPCSGTVVKFSNYKGYGFIFHHATSCDIFVHRSYIFSSSKTPILRVGQEVEFTIATDARTGKPMAMNVTKPNGAEFKDEVCHMDRPNLPTPKPPISFQKNNLNTNRKNNFCDIT